jgi:hypothetical protein
MKNLLILVILAIAASSAAHEGDCPYCKLKLVQNNKEQDNEVVVKFGNKRIEYRCISCIIKDQARYKSDLIVYAPSEKVGEPVVLKRTGGKWSAPAGSVFLNAFTKHDDCAELSRAFSSKDAFSAYAKMHGAETAKPLSLDEFISVLTKSKTTGV